MTVAHYVALLRTPRVRGPYNSRAGAAANMTVLTTVNESIIAAASLVQCKTL